MAAALLAASGSYLFLAPQLPPVDVLRQVKLQEPLRVYSNDGLLMGEFGEMRRAPVHYAEIPPLLVKAVLAAEDDRFLEHRGVDVSGLARAAWELATTRSIQSGGSTITMQVARNYFLSREQSFIRKFNEILLALRIERELNKQQILELYLNKIFLGYRAYGVQAAAQVYYGRPVGELTLAEMAMIAGLPKAPSRLNPLDNPARATERRNWILGRMLELGHIQREQWLEARGAAVSATYHGARIELDAGYAAEMVRAEMLQRYGHLAYENGYVVRTTIESRLQLGAEQAVTRGILAYDARHGYRGAESHLTVTGGTIDQTAWQQRLRGMRSIAGLEPAVVTSVEEQSAELLMKDGDKVQLAWEQGLSRARRFISVDYRGPAPVKAEDVLAVGDVVRLRRDEEQGWRLAQLPRVQAALVSLDADTGAVRALVGGLEFRHSKFNRIAQAKRQPGSNIKPFIYAAAMENGFTPATIINDAPIVFQDPGLEEVWRPENDSGKFYGPTSLRTGLVNSRNLVSIRLLQQLGVDTAVEYLERLGFEGRDINANLSLALGTLTVTPLRLVSAYAALANGGFRIDPYLISELSHTDGATVFTADPARACDACNATRPRSGPFEEAATMEELLARREGRTQQTQNVAPRPMDPRVAYMIDSILKDAVRYGTGRRALELRRNDVAGKTGTTNGPTDAWFSGYVGNIVTTAWLGFDDNQPLGRQEYGGSAALPIWVDYMREATRELPTQHRPLPAGLVSVRIDPQTGLLAMPGQQDARFELFMLENVPSVTPNGDEYRQTVVPDEYDSLQIF